MKRYKCTWTKSCKFVTGSRKKMREHLKKEHNVKGGNADADTHLSKYYESEDVEWE